MILITACPAASYFAEGLAIISISLISVDEIVFKISVEAICYPSK